MTMSKKVFQEVRGRSMGDKHNQTLKGPKRARPLKGPITSRYYKLHDASGRLVELHEFNHLLS